MNAFSKMMLSKTVLQSNLSRLKKTCKKVMVIVKANAYGHGMAEIVKLLDGGADFFGVANIEEARELRKLDKKTPILVLCRTLQFKECVKHNISFMIENLNDLQQLQKLKSSKKARVHIKLNTGMNRLGIKEISKFKTLMNQLDKNKVVLEGIYTHLASTLLDKEYTKKQLEKFWIFVNSMELPEEVIKHIGGSGALLYDLAGFDMIRCGRGLYGYDEGMHPVMKLTCKPIKVINLKAGERLGYNNGFIAQKDMKIAIFPLGYYDGFPKALKDKYHIKIGGNKCLLVGNICMDMCYADVTGVKVRENTNAVMFDDANEIADITGQSLYEVLVNFSCCRAVKI